MGVCVCVCMCAVPLTAPPEIEEEVPLITLRYGSVQHLLSLRRSMHNLCRCIGFNIALSCDALTHCQMTQDGVLCDCAHRLQTALVDVAYNANRLHVGAAMRALTIEDQLMVTVDPGMAHLAQSGGEGESACTA